MKAFLKENIVLVSGLMLPIVVAVMFLMATQIGRASIDPPQYSVVFATNYYNNAQAPYKLVVKDGGVKMLYSPSKNYHIQGAPRLYVYDPVLNVSREIEVPAVEDTDVKSEVVISEFAGVKVSSVKTSPDGYLFQQNYRGDGNLITNMFGGGYRSRSTYVLKKDYHSVQVPEALRYNSAFIGWVVED